MDNKQKHILKNICEKNNLGKPKTFIQHRNLKEFRSFYIERINPTHRIFLFGRLKRKQVKDGCNNKVIKAGEILLCFGMVLFINDVFLTFAVNIIVGMLLLSILTEDIIHVNWNRGECRKRENALSCPLS